MDSFWKGSFLPIRKHRDRCGDIKNHFGVLDLNIERATDEADPVQIWLATVTIGFEESDEEVYEYPFYIKTPNLSYAEAERLVEQELMGEVDSLI